MNPIALSSIIVHNIPRVLTRIPLQVPNYFRSGYPQQIVGHFDGDFTTSSLQLNDNPLEIIAESPDVIIVVIPENLVGIQELEIIENDFSYTTNINIVDLNLSADKMKLSRGESTTIHLEIIGLEHLEQLVEIHIDNLTPKAISLSQGNHQVLVMEPKMVNEQGVFTTDYQISAQQTGGFSISTQLQESELRYADILALDEMNPSEPNADEKPAEELKERAPVPPPDELNPDNPTANEVTTSMPDSKKIGDDRLANTIPDGKKIGEDRLASVVDKQVKGGSKEVVDADNTFCGKIETKWKEIKGTGVLQEGSSENIIFKRTKCKKCGKYVNWKQYTTKFTIRVKVKRLAGLCPLKKGHKGDHKGLKTEFDYQDRTEYKNRKVKTGCSECGDFIKVDSKWKNLKKWVKKKEKIYKKNNK